MSLEYSLMRVSRNTDYCTCTYTMCTVYRLMSDVRFECADMALGYRLDFCTNLYFTCEFVPAPPRPRESRDASRLASLHVPVPVVARDPLVARVSRRAPRSPRRRRKRVVVRGAPPACYWPHSWDLGQLRGSKT